MSLSNVKHLSKFLVLNQKGLLRQDNNLNSDFWTQVRRGESLSQKCQDRSLDKSQYTVQSVVPDNLFSRR